MDSWVSIKEFSKYEINSEGMVRNAMTKKMISQRLGSKYSKYCTLYNDYGERKNVNISELMKEYFPHNDQEEEWVPIKNYEKYSVSRSGKVKNNETKRVFNPKKTNKGYFSVTLKGKDNKYHAFLIHRLVAQAFIPNPDNLSIVNHIDENRKNNSASNLEWVSLLENSRHGSSSHRIGLRHSIPVNEYDEDGKYLRTWKSYKHVKLVYKTRITSSIKNGYCCGHLFRPYKNSITDLCPEEIPKHKPKRAFEKENIIIPQEYLFVFTNEMDISEIFRKYKTIGLISSSDRKKDFERVLLRIEELENELSKR